MRMSVFCFVRWRGDLWSLLCFAALCFASPDAASRQQQQEEQEQEEQLKRQKDAETETTSDRDILLVLYKETEGQLWHNNAGWCSDKPLDEWHGVTTTAAGRVVALELRYNNLRGMAQRYFLCTAAAVYLVSHEILRRKYWVQVLLWSTAVVFQYFCIKYLESRGPFHVLSGRCPRLPSLICFWGTRQTGKQGGSP